jgi:small-conductance mechanosensitive channel
VELGAWPFVYIADFLSFQRDFPERVKHGFGQASVAIPYPQQDVHVVSQTQN